MNLYVWFLSLRVWAEGNHQVAQKEILFMDFIAWNCRELCRWNDRIERKSLIASNDRSKNLFWYLKIMQAFIFSYFGYNYPSSLARDLSKQSWFFFFSLFLCQFYWRRKYKISINFVFGVWLRRRAFAAWHTLKPTKNRLSKRNG